MERLPELEQAQRLTVKSVDQVFVARAQKGLGCSLFKAEALTELVKDAYFSWLSQPKGIQMGQLAMTAISADKPGHKPLTKCKMVPVILTLCAGPEDYQYRLAKEPDDVTAMRRRQIKRLAQKALDQGALLTAEDLAFRPMPLFGVLDGQTPNSSDQITAYQPLPLTNPVYNQGPRLSSPLTRWRYR